MSAYTAETVGMGTEGWRLVRYGRIGGVDPSTACLAMSTKQACTGDLLDGYAVAVAPQSFQIDLAARHHFPQVAGSEFKTRNETRHGFLHIAVCRDAPSGFSLLRREEIRKFRQS